MSKCDDPVTTDFDDVVVDRQYQETPEVTLRQMIKTNQNLWICMLMLLTSSTKADGTI
jgi:hypothetical protein